MRNLKDIKQISVIIYLVMIIPFGKLEVPNLIPISVNIFHPLSSEGFPFRHLFLILCLTGIYLIYFKTKYYVIIGYLLTYSWLFYKIDFTDIKKSMAVSISVIVYVLISVYTSYRILRDLKGDVYKAN